MQEALLCCPNTNLLHINIFLPLPSSGYAISNSACLTYIAFHFSRESKRTHASCSSCLKADSSLALTLLHKLNSQSWAVGAHQGEHADHHYKHPRAQNWWGHYQQLLNICQQIFGGNLLEQILHKHKKDKKYYIVSQQLDDFMKRPAKTECLPPRVGSCPRDVQNKGKCFLLTFCPVFE